MSRFSVEELERSWMEERARRESGPSPERIGRILASCLLLEGIGFSAGDLERLVLSDPWPGFHVDMRAGGPHLHEIDRLLSGIRMAGIAFPPWDPRGKWERTAPMCVLDGIVERAARDCPEALAWAKGLAGKRGGNVDG